MTLRPIFDASVLVAQPEGVRQPVRGVQAIDARGQGALGATRVERQPGELEGAISERVDHVLRPRHRGHASGIDEAGGLDAPQAGCRQPAAELGARLGREHDGIVLEAVPRAHVAHEESSHAPQSRKLSPTRGLVDSLIPGKRHHSTGHTRLHIPR